MKWILWALPCVLCAADLEDKLLSVLDDHAAPHSGLVSAVEQTTPDVIALALEEHTEALLPQNEESTSLFAQVAEKVQTPLSHAAFFNDPADEEIALAQDTSYADPIALTLAGCNNGEDCVAPDALELVFAEEKSRSFLLACQESSLPQQQTVVFDLRTEERLPEPGKMIHVASHQAIIPATPSSPVVPATVPVRGKRPLRTVATMDIDDRDMTASVNVRRFKVVGATILPTKQLECLANTYAGKRWSLEALQGIAKQISETYREAGFVAKAFVPEQSFDDGVISIAVIEK